jgi:uncharacterized protein YcbX
VITLGALRIHPVKSCAAIELDESELDRYGLALDRAWMAVDESGRFLTQRECGALARVRPALEGDALVLHADGAAALRLPLDGGGASPREIAVWRYRGAGLDAGDTAARWISERLGRSARLVRIPPGHARRVNPDFFPGEAYTAFSDGYPLLVLSEASLRDLEERVGEALDPRRFRANLWLRGCEPYAEDRWLRIRVGEVELALVKPCDRCVITTLDPERGESTGDEPLRTLAGYRRAAAGVLFGWYAVHLGPGRLRVGDPVTLLQTR